MYHTARPERRAAAGGLLLSLALTSFLTGVTEPIEFTFMFLAPLLYAMHALATGLAMVILDALHVRLGFSFSAGLFDYLLNFSHAQHPLLLLPIGAGYFALYYAVFRTCIVRLNLVTPGREPDEAAAAAVPTEPAALARAFIHALGGAANLHEVAACTTRLRLLVADPAAVNDTALKALGARGVLRMPGNGLQVVLGPVADQRAGEIRAALTNATPVLVAMPAAGPARPPVPEQASGADAAALVQALGGRANVLSFEPLAGRLVFRTLHPQALDATALERLGIRGVAHASGNGVQLLVPAGGAWDEPLRCQLAAPFP